MDKEVLYICAMKCYSDIKKNEILPFAMTQMDIEDIMLKTINQTENNKSSMLSLICGILKIYK